MTHGIGKNAKGTHVMCMVEKEDCFAIHFIKDYEELAAFCAARWPAFPEIWRIVLEALEKHIWHRGVCVTEGLRFFDVNLAESVVLPAVVSQPEFLGVLKDISGHLQTIAHREYSGEVVGS